MDTQSLIDNLRGISGLAKGQFEKEADYIAKITTLAAQRIEKLVEENNRMNKTLFLT